MARNTRELKDALAIQKYSAAEKKYAETIVFVHFFDGSPQLIKRHIQFVNDLGYDAYAYQVSFHIKNRPVKDFLPQHKRLGFKNFWTKDLERVLEQVEGAKIIYAFSNPASAAFEAAAKGKYNIKAIICDSGPFFDLFKCSRNLIREYFKVKNPLLNIPSSIGLATVLAPLHETYINKDLASLPKNFPILSIRGWQDQLVPKDAIEKVFAKHSHLDLEVLNLPDAGHVNGLKDFADDYKPVVTDFLERNSSKI